MLNSTIWCEHCGMDLKPNSVRSCIRSTCQTKAMLPQHYRQELAAIRGQQVR